MEGQVAHGGKLAWLASSTQLEHPRDQVVNPLASGGGPQGVRHCFEKIGEESELVFGEESDEKVGIHWLVRCQDVCDMLFELSHFDYC